MGDCPHLRTPRERFNGDMGSENVNIKAALDADSVKTAISVPEKEQPRKPGSEGDQGGESSGNNASNGTTQRLNKTEQILAEASTAGKPQSDDLHELSRRGFCAHPLARAGKPAQAGTGVSDIDQLQTTWCRYADQQVQRGATWLAYKSPSVQRRLVQKTPPSSQLQAHSSPWAPAKPGAVKRDASASGIDIDQSNAEDVKVGRQHGHDVAGQHVQSSTTDLQAQHTSDTKRPTYLKLPEHSAPLPASPFTTAPILTPQLGAKVEAEANAAPAQDTSPHTPSNQSKFLWAESPRQSYSEGENIAGQHREGRQPSMMRQVSLPDINVLADLWDEMPEEFLDLDNPPKDGGLGGLAPQPSLGPRQTSLARFERSADMQLPMRLLQDIKTQRRNRSLKLTSALTWQPGSDADTLQGPRNTSLPGSSGALQDSLHLHMADRSSSSGFTHPDTAAQIRGMDLPEQIQLSLVGAPSIFSVPTCINKSFKPAFTVRVTIASTQALKFTASVTAYTLQKEQLAKLESWHPSQHVYTESLSGAVETAAVQCDQGSSKANESHPGKHVGTVDLAFNNLKFNTSSRMKPRWLLFALTLPTDDVIFVQYTVPTIVMSRQCDQTPRALAILRGEMPTRKRARQYDTPEVPRHRPAPFQGSSPSNFFSPALGSRPPFPFQDQSLNSGEPYVDTSHWPQQGPYIMPQWRQAIQKVCRAFGLTRSFEQEDMHELAKMAGFVRPGGQGISVLTEYQWNRFGKWFIGILTVLRMNKHLWMSLDLVTICGFAATREWTDQLLGSQPEGTFLMRPSMAMEATLVISVATRTRVMHLAIDYRQLMDRSLEDWVIDLPDTHSLLDINTGIRYPKEQVFNHRNSVRAPPALRDYPELNFGSPVGSAQGSQSMMQAMQSQGPNSVAGPDALAQIFEASRRGSDTLPGANYPSQGFQKPFGGLPAAAFDPATAPSPRSLDPWGAVAPREGGPMQQLDGGDHLGFAPPPFFSGHTSMRYQGY